MSVANIKHGFSKEINKASLREFFMPKQMFKLGFFSIFIYFASSSMLISYLALSSALVSASLVSFLPMMMPGRFWWPL